MALLCEPGYCPYQTQVHSAESCVMAHLKGIARREPASGYGKPFMALVAWCGFLAHTSLVVCHDRGQQHPHPTLPGVHTGIRGQVMN